MKNKFIVYKIEINGITRYIGKTNNLKKREYQHNYLFKKGVDKELYNNIRLEGIKYISLVPVLEFKDKVSSKRYECYLILKDLFENEKTLWQKIPNISDR